MNHADNSAIAPILGRLPSGIFVLTIADGGRRTGMLASWVMQAGFDPPMVSVAVKQGRYVGQWLKAGRPFVLNVVAEGQKNLLAHFGRGFEADADAFNGLPTSPSPRGVPILDGVVGHLECEPQAHVDSGDHHVFLAKITSGQLNGDARPMVHIRKNGLGY